MRRPLSGSDQPGKMRIVDRAAVAAPELGMHGDFAAAV
jgi:hypothetical protein